MTDTQPAEATAVADFDLHLPDSADAAARQDQEWCEITLDGRRERIRFHDYARIYSIPGLYERLIYEQLGCDSPRVVAGLLARQLRDRAVDPSELRVLDLGAGNGIVAEHLSEVDVDYLVGADILPEAAEAADRDRPGLYVDYVVGDLTDPTSDARDRLAEHELNAMTCVAALGFGDIPPPVFAAALDAVATPGWVAFTIKSDFLTDGDPSGFSEMIQGLSEDGTLGIVARERYCHRFNWAGEPLEYVAVIAEKRAK
jgi:SAM-dependent methyltransferase